MNFVCVGSTKDWPLIGRAGEVARNVSGSRYISGWERLASTVKRNQELRRLVIGRRLRRLEGEDVLLASYPKSGSTWIRCLVATALGCGIDYDKLPDMLPPLGREDEGAVKLPDGGRLIKTHDSGDVVGTNGNSVVLIVRDVRDVAVSYYHHIRRTRGAEIEFQAFIEEFLRGRVGAYGRWDKHALSWYRRRGDGNILMVRYEDVLWDGPRVVSEMLEWLGISVSKDEAEEILEENSPEKMRSRESGAWLERQSDGEGPFVRAAEAGGWRGYFDGYTASRFDATFGDALVAFGYALSGEEP